MPTSKAGMAHGNSEPHSYSDFQPYFSRTRKKLAFPVHAPAPSSARQVRWFPTHPVLPAHPHGPLKAFLPSGKQLSGNKLDAQWSKATRL